MRNVILIISLLCSTVLAIAANISGTLPVMYINTEEGKPIVDKINYVNATYYVDPMGIESVEAVGSSDNPQVLLIRGRGNYTWGYFDKKPYRIKLDKKTALLGMKKSKHFVLLAHADDQVAFLRNTVSFEISRRIGMPYTPEQRPIEVVLNGDYIGLYFLTENIRVDKDRVNITEQADEETATEAITGGWLVEIDNNRNTEQIQLSVEGTDLEWLWITYHSPEVLSEEQTAYLTTQFETIKQVIYTADKESKELEQLVDMTSLAKYYIIQEVVDHLEGFLGSCWIYKDRGEEKWHFGPVWDFGHAFNSSHSKQKFIYEDTPFPVSIIKEIAKFPRFQEEVKRIWNEFYPVKLEGIEDFMNSFLSQISEAANSNAQRWPTYGNADVWKSSQPAFTRLRSKTAWLDNQWHFETGVHTISKERSSKKVYYNISGGILNGSLKSRGIYLVKDYSSDRTLSIRKVLR